MGAESIVEELTKSYYELYDKFGVRPTHFIICHEYFTTLIAQTNCIERKQCAEGDSFLIVMGLKVIKAAEPKIAKAAIIDEDY